MNRRHSDFPEDSSQRWALGVECETRNDYQRALELYQSCVEAPGIDKAEALFRCGWVLECIGREALRAREYYARAAATAANAYLRGEALFRQAWLAILDHAYSEAGRFLKQTLEQQSRGAVNPLTMAHANYWLGVCYEVEGRHLEAVKLYDRVLAGVDASLEPEALFRRMTCLVAVGDLAGAVTTAERLIGLPALGSAQNRILELSALAAQELDQIRRAFSSA